MSDNVTVNIDVGGTFTDGFFTYGEENVRTKVPTTKHDLTVCFMECIERGADALDLPISKLLERADTVRFSTTLGTNTVIEKTGPQLGLLVTAGHGDDLYAGDADRTVLDAFVRPDLVEVIDERVSTDGEILARPDSEEVVNAVKQMQERGARVIVIALENAFANDANERAVKRAIDEEYPRHYLGATPTLASYEVTDRPDDFRRLNTVAVNAYLHRPMKTSLYRAEDQVRDNGFEEPLLIGHSSGGCARVAKTIALNTYNSGPAAGAVGVRSLSTVYDQGIVAADMGGTSIDISLVSDQQVDLELNPEIDGIPTQIPAINVSTVGAGGGSIASVDDGNLSVGPESAGAQPGPACYGQGGQKATVTDADVVRGIVNPEYFLGGRRTLEADRATSAIEEHVADPLGISVEEAAARIADHVETKIADAITGVGETDIDTVIAYGGAGPVHAAGFAEKAGAHRVIITPYSSVFSAFGESIMDVSHTYSRPLLKISVDAIESAIEDARKEAHRDMGAEGFAPAKIELEVDVIATWTDSTNTIQPIETPVTEDAITSLSDAKALTLRTHASGEVPKWEFTQQPLANSDPTDASKEVRNVYWEDGSVPTPIYQREDLRPGNVVEGSAILEARDTTITIPDESTFEINTYGHGVLEL